MADDDSNLVSQIQITGGDQAAQDINKFASSGSQAFDKLGASADKAGAQVAAATGAISKGASDATEAARGLNAVSLQNFSANMGKVKDSLDKISDTFPRLTQAAGRFAQRIAVVGAGFVAIGVKMASTASSVAAAYNGTSNAADKLVQSQIDANNQALAQEEAQINLESSFRKLNQQLAVGAISYQQYSQQVLQLKQNYQEQQRVANEVANAQQRVKEQNDALQKSLADKKAYDELIAKFGGPLLSAFVSLGNQLSQIKQQFTTAFSPALAKVVDLIGATLSKNATAITNFINTAAAKIDDLVTKHGPQLQEFAEKVGGALSSIFLGLIDAAPSIIDFFNNTLIPLGQKVARGFQFVADAINSVFGTKLTGGSIFILTFLAQISGTLRLTTTLVKSSGIIWKEFFNILGEGVQIIGKLFGGGKVTSQIISFGIAITKSTNPVKLFFNILKGGIPLIITLAELVGTALGVSFAVALPIVIALGVALAYLATKIDWKAFGAALVKTLQDIGAWLLKTWENAKATANGIQGAWNALVNWFSGIASSIGAFLSSMWSGAVALASAAIAGIQAAWGAVVQFFSNIATSVGNFFSTLWDNVVSYAQSAITTIQGAWSAVVAWFTANIVTPISTAFTTAWTAISDATATVVKAIQDAWNGIVAFFQGLWQQISDGFNNIISGIQSAWSSMLNAVQGFFSSWYTAIIGYLQPVLDMINKIISLLPGVGGADTGSGPVTAADGGYISGPGTATSDSIPAWLSNGEFVVRAKSVAKYGAGLLSRINRGTFRVPGFAEGGIVAPMSPSATYAHDNGSADGPALSPLNLTLFGEQFKGLMMPEDVGRRLTKFAIQKQTTSAGRKPSWVGGGRN